MQKRCLPRTCWPTAEAGACPPLRDAILLPDQAQPPARKYLDWHQASIFAA
jgi:hypothetical protein